jgi:Possible lysine decarboxylase
MQTGKARIIPVVLVDRPGGTYWKTWIRFLEEHLLRMGLISADDFSLFKMCNSVDEAVAEIAQFYKNYHSYRWVGQKMVIRVRRRLTDKAVEAINAAFSDVLNGNQLEQGEALPQEINEPDLEKLPRLIFTPKRKNFGRFRKLIDAINAAETEN